MDCNQSPSLRLTSMKFLVPPARAWLITWTVTDHRDPSIRSRMCPSNKWSHAARICSKQWKITQAPINSIYFEIELADRKSLYAYSQCTKWTHKHPLVCNFTPSFTCITWSLLTSTWSSYHDHEDSLCYTQYGLVQSHFQLWRRAKCNESPPQIPNSSGQERLLE